MQPLTSYLTKEGWTKDWEETQPRVRRGIEDILNLTLPPITYYSRLVGESAILFGTSTLISGTMNYIGGLSKPIDKEDMTMAGLISCFYFLFGMLKDASYAFRNKGDLYDMFKRVKKEKSQGEK